MAGRLITSGPNKYSRPGSSTLTTAQIISNVQNEQQRVNEEKNIKAEKAKQQKALQAAVYEFDVLTTAKKARYVELAALETTLRNLYIAFAPPPYTSGEQANLNNAILNITNKNSEIASLTTRINTAETLKKSIQNQLISSSQAAAKKEFDARKPVINPKTKKPSGKKAKEKPIKGATEDPPPTTTPPAPFYTYNAPMVRSAYFRNEGPQSENTFRGMSDAGNYADAKNMYTPIKYDPITGTVLESAPAAKGTIQMSRSRIDNTQFYNKKTDSSIDPTMYGFKFLYNPTEVSMGWGIAEGFNPEVTQGGADGGITPVGAGLNQSTVDFTLLLNRIGDMSYLDSNGLITGATNPYPGNFNKLEDLKMIYKKGTMYDIEYLFRTINGPNATYQSSLNDRTADRGYLTGAQVELHLGDGLRYLVRIGSIAINHTVFNDRMVPIISNVQISCHRFYDPPEIKD
jgi:hypothetical protein